MRNIKLTIEYDGSSFNGWQKQPNKLNIQGEIEKAIETVTGKKVELIGSGRTDAGVHAFAQVANFKIDSDFPIEKVAIALNSQLKKSICIKKAEEVSEDFHSRYHCHQKTYGYIIDNSKQGTAIYRNLVYHVSQMLDTKAMQEAANYLIGEHDFSSFKSSGTSSKSSVRTIYAAQVLKEQERVIIQLTGNGFLYNMVRIIAGTLVEIGLGIKTPEEMKTILEAKDRQQAGKTLPPQGLFLMQVDYEEK
ncbi:MAG: tRNA pseudouridine(38-40) synthase TruA [Clostridia bacterium]|nr:tRNA pseudouridine(38-40) synthase TruA [Clostridia bacterium]